MTEPRQGVCAPWATEADVCAPCTGYDFDPLTLADALLAASDVLFSLSGHRFPGECEDVVRPAGSWDGIDLWRLRRLYPGWDSSVGGLWPGWDGINCGCGGRRVGCSWLPEIDLGPLPVTGVTEVLVDGETVDPSTYRVDEYRWLVRTTPNPETPNQGWPCCQALDMPATQVGTFQVTYTYGTPPPALGVSAAAALACQLALSCDPNGAEDCRLPERVTSITRQGVSMVVIDPFDFLDAGKTGIYEVDLFLKSVNPAGLHRPPAVIAPGMSVVRRTNT